MNEEPQIRALSPTSLCVITKPIVEAELLALPPPKKGIDAAELIIQDKPSASSLCERWVPLVRHPTHVIREQGLQDN